MKRTDIMEVINEQRRQEPFKKNVTKQYLGSWSNGFYLVAVIGVYRLLVYSVSSHQRGRNPQKYYNNLLNYEMMKFQGASVVRNMLVIVLLIVGGMHAACYVPMVILPNVNTGTYEAKYSYRYLLDGEVPEEAELEEIASEHEVQIENYREGEFIRIPGSAVNRDTDAEGTRIIEEFVEGVAEYYLIRPSGSVETHWNRFDDMSELYSQTEDAYLPMKYIGNTEYNSMIMKNSGLGEQSRFVVNDADYERLRADLPNNKIGVQVLFDSVESEGEISFATALFKRLVEGMSADMNHMANYNPMTEQRVGAEEYRDISRLFWDWRFGSCSLFM